MSVGDNYYISYPNDYYFPDGLSTTFTSEYYTISTWPEPCDCKDYEEIEYTEPDEETLPEILEDFKDFLKEIKEGKIDSLKILVKYVNDPEMYQNLEDKIVND